MRLNEKHTFCKNASGHPGLEVVLANGYFENLALKHSQFQMPFIYLINGH